jgi:cysteinyl-tRNA synthetase
MSCKYLGEQFDIHGGGMDLMFPHHECEIAQATAALGRDSARYWLHNNMITIDGKKMGKSYNNFITLPQFFAGEHERLERGYSPMTIRFFILQAHYRSTVDFSNEALQSAEKGLARLMDGWKALKRLKEGQKVKGQPWVEMQYVDTLRQNCYDAMNDDMASPMVISHLFDACRVLNTIIDKKASIKEDVVAALAEVFHTFAFEILGLSEEKDGSNKAREEAFGKVVDIVLEQRQQAKAEKNWALSDQIRDNLSALGFEVKDTKDGFTWSLNK